MNLSTTAQEAIINLLQREEFDEVINFCNDSQGVLQNAELLQFKAIAECKKGELKQAKTTFLQAIQVKPNDPTLLYNYSEVLTDLGDESAAESILIKISKDHPNFEPAKTKLKVIDNQKKNLSTKTGNVHQFLDLDRSLDPLRAAFSQDEVQKTYENHVERQKKTNQLNSKDRPSLPTLDNAVLADEWLLAAEDALRANQVDLALKLCSQAIQISSNHASVYALAGDCYLAINQYNYSQLCYLIASQFNSLELPRQMNLVSLAQALGDNYLFETRYDELNSTLKEQESMKKLLQKIHSRKKQNCSVEFLSDKGPSRKVLE